MYKAFYGMQFDPFSKEINTKYTYESKDFKEAISRLQYLKDIKWPFCRATWYWQILCFKTFYFIAKS